MKYRLGCKSQAILDGWNHHVNQWFMMVHSAIHIYKCSPFSTPQLVSVCCDLVFHPVEPWISLTRDISLQQLAHPAGNSTWKWRHFFDAAGSAVSASRGSRVALGTSFGSWSPFYKRRPWDKHWQISVLIVLVDVGRQYMCFWTMCFLDVLDYILKKLVDLQLNLCGTAALYVRPPQAPTPTPTPSSSLWSWSWSSSAS